MRRARSLRSIAVMLFVSGLVFLLSMCSPSTDEVPRISPTQQEFLLLDEEERRKTVIWDIDVDTGKVATPEQWNPFMHGARRDKGLHQVLIEPLFVLNYESGTIEPWLGKRMTANAEQDVWTLELREGVTWSDGEAFNADDVVFTVRMLLNNPELDTDFYSGFVNWVGVNSVQKIDDLTVRFDLLNPNPRFQVDYFSVKVWGSFPIVPEHIWSDQDPMTFTNYDPQKGWPVFTGPYTLEDFNDTTFVYVRDDDWWGAQAGFHPLPRPERMIWTATATEEAMIDMAANSQLDSLGDLTLNAFLELKERNPNIIGWHDGPPYAWMDPCSRMFSLNHTVAPWGDKAMRWAINYAIDRNEIVRDAYQGTTFASKHFFPAYPPLNRYVALLEDEGLYEQYPLMTHDPERARAIIEEQGWSMGSDGYYQRAGEQLSLDIQVHGSFIEKQRIASVLVDQLQRVGINASMRKIDPDLWLENKERGEYEAVVDWDACGSIHEPWASMSRYHEEWIVPVGERVIGRNNHIRWRNAEYSALVDEIRDLPLGDPRVDALFIEAMQIWLDELPFIPITQAKKLVPFDTTYWTGWPTSKNNYVHPPSWWQSGHLIIHQLEPAEQ